MDVLAKARRAVADLAERCSRPQEFGSFSISIYDTAWLALLEKPGKSRTWLFPESFSYLLSHQAEDGMWPTYAAPIDGILNTLAGLLTLVKHERAGIVNTDSSLPTADWSVMERIVRARQTLGLALHKWDVNQTLHVGFEILVPALLKQLSEEGIVFEFDGQLALMALYHKKIAKFHPEMVVSEEPTTLLHSLEAMVGVFDFGLLRHHCTAYGGMLGSPASTAAYLLHSPDWDLQAQTYLENVVRSYGSCGGVPSGFPTPVFEISWTVSTLLTSDFSIGDFQGDDIRTITNFLRKAIDDQKGLLGFAPDFLPDADDTAKSLVALTALGVQIDRAPLIQTFEGTSHFKTYQFERTPSISANCNVLLALLMSPKVDQYLPQIEKAVKFLSTCWNTSKLQDKWNLSTEYTDMLLAAAFHQLLSVYDRGSLQEFTADIIKIDVPIILVQLLGRTVSKQQGDGSWGDSVERTAHGALLIAYTIKLPWPLAIRKLAEAAFSKAKKYLQARSHEWAAGEYLWIEKVTYKLSTLSEAYCLAAMNALAVEQVWTPQVRHIFSNDGRKMKNMVKFFGHLALLQELSEMTMIFAVYEADFHSSHLRKARLEIFPRDTMGMSTDKYLEYIPIAWTAINAVNEYRLSGVEMREMMLISLLNYQADEYMESVVAHLSLPSSEVLSIRIGTEIRNAGSKPAPSPSLFSAASHPTIPTLPQSNLDLHSESSALTDAGEVLSRYIRHVKRHPALLSSPESAQLRVMQELEKFLLAHIAHNADNARLRRHQYGADKTAESQQDQMPYFDWVRSTGANDTSCPYSFAFFCCLISMDGPHCLVSLEQRYLARELCLHLATLCRQYNDYGSATRDYIECNLNSLHFPEFGATESGNSPYPVESNDVGQSSPLEKAKEVLLKIANIERACMQVCWEALSPSLSEDVRIKIKAFIEITDLFGQLYVARDIASRNLR